MRMTFWGGAGTVTGSACLLESEKNKVLVDCGMFQGGKALKQLNMEEFPFSPGEIDYVLLTHAHIDHSGLIPKLYKHGFQGKILASKATVDLCQIMLPDSGHIQEVENEWLNRKRSRSGLPPVEPLYTVQDAQACLSLFEPVDYGHELEVAPGITVRYNVSGHILGSAFLEVWLDLEQGKKKIVFSGDLGNLNRPIVKDPQTITEADMVVMESTYGNRIHETTEETYHKLEEIVTKTIERGGKVIIPAFAVGRTQEILYALNEMVNEGRIPLVPVYLDSPLAISATKVFEKNTHCYDEAAAALLEAGDNPFDFPTLAFTATADESRRLNEDKTPSIIISASGMADAGRIKHHLKHNLWKPETSVVFVGYQAQGSLGRRILDGEKRVRILGEEISIRAEIYSLPGLSAHADQVGIMNWLSEIKTPLEKVFLVHGEEDSLNALKQRIEDELKLDVVIPERGEIFDLSAVAGKGVASVHRREVEELTDWQLVDELYQNLCSLEDEYNLFRERLLDLAIHKGEQRELLKAIDQLVAIKEKIKQTQ
jgi:metallo-beta-lactamase family protein